MRETRNQPFQLSFNASLKVDFQGSRVTSDGGLILVRELDERLGFGELIEQHLTDSRRWKNTQFPFADLLRQSVYSRLAGYEDALARRVGESTTGSYFSDARGTGRQSVAGIGRKRVSFGLWGSRERQNGTIRGPWERLDVQIRLPTSSCVRWRSGVSYGPGRRSIMEIPV
jgi:hypothetical protein